jgi:hypothetical protein
MQGRAAFAWFYSKNILKIRTAHCPLCATSLALWPSFVKMSGVRQIVADL